MGWEQAQPRTEIKVLSGCPPLHGSHCLQSKTPFQYILGVSLLLKSSHPGSSFSYSILSLLGFSAWLPYNKDWCELQFLDPARGTAARLWDQGNTAFTVLLGHAARAAVELPPVIVTRADGTVTVSGCDMGMAPVGTLAGKWLGHSMLLAELEPSTSPRSSSTGHRMHALHCSCGHYLPEFVV